MKISNKIFISYKRSDVDKAQRLRLAFRAEGINVWWDEELNSGEHWTIIINSVLKRVYAVVVLWSSESVKSDWVRYEAAIGNYRSLLTHAFIDKVELPEPFRSIHVADLSNWAGNEDDINFLRLINSIKKLKKKALIKKISQYCFYLSCILFLLVSIYIHINPIEKKNNKLNALRFHGIYRSPPKNYPAVKKLTYWHYLRFYPDNTFLSVSSIAKPIDLQKWFNKEKKTDSCSSGKITIEGNHISFSTVLSEGVVEYDGEIKDNKIQLNIHNHINNYNTTGVYDFVKW